MRCGAHLDAGILRPGMDIEYLMGMAMQAMAMVTLGELCPGNKSWLFLRNGKDA